MILAVILFIILGGVLGVVGIISIFVGIIDYHNNKSMGILAIVFGSLIVALTIVCTIGIIIGNKEKTEKIVGRGVISESDDIDYVDGGGISSDKFTFYYLMENGDKIIVDKAEWESDKTEFTYREFKVEKIGENS